MINYIKIWISVVKKYTDLKCISLFLVEFFVYILIIYLVIENINLSVIVSILLITIRLFVQLYYFYKKLVDLNQYNLILLKPIDPLFGLLVFNHNPIDILILLPILIYIKIKNYKK